MSDGTAATFQQEVIERSSAGQLVLVDFWAPWCNPCRVLAPMLEAAVEAREGRVWLVKVNTDVEQSLALRFRVQGIPAVKAFMGGRLVDELLGVPDRRFLEGFLDRLLPSAEESALRAAEALLKDGQPERVPAVLAPALESPRHHDEALLLRARSELARADLASAERTLGEITENGLVAGSAASLAARLELLRASDGVDPSSLRLALDQHPGDLDARWALAATLLAAGRPDAALEELLQLLQRDRAYRKDGARRAMLSILDELGPEHDLAREYRRRMQVYL